MGAGVQATGLSKFLLLGLHRWLAHYLYRNVHPLSLTSTTLLEAACKRCRGYALKTAERVPKSEALASVANRYPGQKPSSWKAGWRLLAEPAKSRHDGISRTNARRGTQSHTFSMPFLQPYLAVCKGKLQGRLRNGEGCGQIHGAAERGVGAKYMPASRTSRSGVVHGPGTEINSGE